MSADDGAPSRSDPLDELAKAQAALLRVQHAAALYKLYFERCNDPIVFIDAKGIIVDANRRAELVFGYPQGELVGQLVHVLLPERLRERHKEHIARIMKNPKDRSMGLNMDLFGFNTSGFEFPVEIELLFYRVPEGLFASGTIKVLDANA